jgi:hypothetical protein
MPDGAHLPNAKDRCRFQWFAERLPFCSGNAWSSRVSLVVRAVPDRGTATRDALFHL